MYKYVLRKTNHWSSLILLPLISIGFIGNTYMESQKKELKIIKSIKPVKDRKNIKHTGNLQIDCDIPNNTHIEVTNGNLTINGKIEDYCLINSTGSEFLLKINGEVKNNVIIKSMGNILCMDIIGCDCVIKSHGSVTGKSIDRGTKVISNTGDITLDYIESWTLVRTSNGRIIMENLIKPLCIRVEMED